LKEKNLKKLQVSYRYIFGGCARSFAKALFFRIFRRQCINKTIKTKETTRRTKNPVLSRLIVGFIK
jgi:hypothetical protein